MARAVIHLNLVADVGDALEGAKLEAGGPQGSYCVVKWKSMWVRTRAVALEWRGRFWKSSRRAQNLL